MYERILIATDGSPSCEPAIEHAVDLARETGADLHAVSVVDDRVLSSYPGDEYVHEREGAESTLEDHAEHALHAVDVRAEEVGVETTLHVEWGEPSEVIADAAEELDVDLVVLGSATRPNEYRHFLGSVTKRVAQLTDRPVTVIKGEVAE